MKLEEIPGSETEFLEANEEKIECINDMSTCSSSQILDSDGFCFDCEKYSRSNSA